MKFLPLAAVFLVIAAAVVAVLSFSFTGHVVNPPEPSVEPDQPVSPALQNESQNTTISSCQDTCTGDRCEGVLYRECLKQENGCRSLQSKGVVKGKCGAQCITNADCSGGICRNSTCSSSLLQIFTGGGGGGSGGTEPEPEPIPQPPAQNTSQNTTQNNQTNTTTPPQNNTFQNTTNQTNTTTSPPNQTNQIFSFSAVCGNNICEVTEYGVCSEDCPGGPDWNYPTLKTFPAFLFYPNGSLKENAFFVINASNEAQANESLRLALWAGNFSNTSLVERIVDVGQLGNPYNKVIIMFGNACNNPVFVRLSAGTCNPFTFIQPGLVYTVSNSLGYYRLVLFASSDTHLQQEVEFFVSNQSLSYNGTTYLVQ